MNYSVLERLERLWPRLVWAAAVGGIMALGISFALPREYSSSMRLLVVQANVAGLDPYTALKSTEQIAGSVRGLVYTSLVANRVLAETAGLESGHFSENEYERRKEWQKAVEVNLDPGTGILAVTAYHADRDQARLLAQGVAKQVMEQTPNFGYNAQARIIDTPLPSRWFARPNLVLNTASGAAVGFGLALLWVLLEKEKDRK